MEGQFSKKILLEFPNQITYEKNIPLRFQEIQND